MFVDSLSSSISISTYPYFLLIFTGKHYEHISFAYIFSQYVFIHVIRDSPLPFPLHYSHYVLGNVIAKGMVHQRFGLTHNIATKLLAAAANMQAIA